MDIWRGLKLLRENLIVFFVVGVIAFVGLMVAPLFTPEKLSIFKSSAKVLITPTTSSVTLAGEKQSGTVKSWFADEATLRTLLASQDLLDIVIQSAGAAEKWSDLRERVELDILSNSGSGQVSLLEISVMAHKSEEARILALTLSEKFIQYIQQLSAAEQDKSVVFLERERRNAEREVARAQKRMLKIGILPRSAGPDPIEQSWVQLQEKRSELERDLALAEAEEGQAAYADGEPGGLGSGPIADSLAKEQLKLAELREVYTDQSPQVKAQLSKVSRLQALLNDEQSTKISSRRAAAGQKTSKLRALLQETGVRLKKLDAARPSAEKHLEYANEERQLQMWQENYLDLTRQLYRARVLQQSSRREGAFTIVEKPQPGKLVSGPVGGSSPWSRAIMAFPVASLIGFAVVFGIDYLSSSMRLEPRIEEALGLPIIGRIPAQAPILISEWEDLKQSINRKLPPEAAPKDDP